MFDSSHIAVSEHGYGGIDFPNVKDDENSYYDPNIDDDTLSFDRYKIIIKSDNGKKIRLYAFYTVEKAEIIRRFVKLLNRQGNKYPIEFTYYTHGRILIDVNLVDGVEYPERFISFFNEMKARL